jgi:hypothetical protein
MRPGSVPANDGLARVALSNWQFACHNRNRRLHYAWGLPGAQTAKFE